MQADKATCEPPVSNLGAYELERLKQIELNARELAKEDLYELRVVKKASRKIKIEALDGDDHEGLRRNPKREKTGS